MVFVENYLDIYYKVIDTKTQRQEREIKVIFKERNSGG